MKYTKYNMQKHDFSIQHAYKLYTLYTDGLLSTHRGGVHVYQRPGAVPVDQTEI